MKYTNKVVIERQDPKSKQIVQVAVGSVLDDLTADEVKDLTARKAIERYTDPTKAAQAAEDAADAAKGGGKVNKAT